MEVQKWPRWGLEHVKRHPVCRHLEVERALEPGEEMDVSQTLLCFEPMQPLDEEMQHQAIARLRWCLGQMPEDLAYLVLTDGFDADGTVHSERLLLHVPLGVSDMATRLLEEDLLVSVEVVSHASEEEETAPVEDDAAEHASEAPKRAVRHPFTETDEVVPPEADVPATSEAPVATPEAPVATPEAPVATSEAPVATPEAPVATSEAAPADAARPATEEDDTPDWLCNPLASEPTTVIVLDDQVVLRLIGVLPPALIRHMASQSMTILTSSNDRTPVFRTGKQVRIGAYTVDVDSYAQCAYKATAQTSTLAPLRRAGGGILRMHRMRQNEFERR